jgi:hypothetical protein
MDFLNERDVFAKIVSPAIDKINNETIPTAERAIQRQVESAKSQVALLLTDAIVAIQTMLERSLAEFKSALNDALERIDGATVVDEIRIPPVHIRLKSKE